MPYRTTTFISAGFYHILNRGVNKQNIFNTDRDYQRFLQTLNYYQFSGPKPKFSQFNRFRLKDYSKNPKIIDVVCFCLMPNHFHLLLRQLQDGGVVEFVSKISNSYTKYFNTKNNRSGPLLQGEFKAIQIHTDAQLLHVSRYIHLNPLVVNLTDNLEAYPYSSYHNYVTGKSDLLCTPDLVLQQLGSVEKYIDFVSGHEDYARELAIMKNLMMDLED